jgi:hypothetical protein
MVGRPTARVVVIEAIAPSPDDPASSSVAAAEVRAVQRALDALVRRVSTGQPARAGSRAEWAGLVEQCQSLVNTATAVQDVAITRLAAIEEEWLEDGTTSETHRAPGHVALDAPDVVAGALGVSHVHAQRRVSLAVRLVADGDRADIEQGAASGLSALHEAMAAGRLDAYRAGVVAEELAEAPSEVAEAVVGTLHAYLGVDTAVQLRQRCRRAIARISPDLLRQRAGRAREECGLMRWAEEPGVDRWEGTFPSEDAAEGWAAVDALAQRYVAEGRCSRVEAARSVALMDLVRAQATVDVQLVVTVPATEVEQAGHGHRQGRVARRPMEPGGHGPIGGTTDSRVARERPEESRAVNGSVGPDATEAADRTGQAGAVAGPDAPDMRDIGAEDHHVVATSGPVTQCVLPPGAPTPDHLSPSGDAERSFGPVSSAEEVRLAASSAFRTLPTDHDRGRLIPPLTTPGPPSRRGSAMAADDLIEVMGPFAGEPMLVRRRWVTDIGVGERVRSAACHVVSGALLDDGPGSTAYRPGARIARLVRLRDGRCRFPGCSVAARFCDLDHVRPWPAGPTFAANLMCLCRRHHRVKQLPGWSVRLDPDGRVTWSDPTGRVRSTTARDLLAPVVLSATDDRRGTEGPSRPGADVLALGGALEVLLAVLADHVGPRAAPSGPRPRAAQADTVRITPAGCRELRYQPVRGHRCAARSWPARALGRPAHSDPPPF